MNDINKTIAKSLNSLNNRIDMIVEGQVVELQFTYNKETKTLNIVSDASCFVYDSENKTLNIMM